MARWGLLPSWAKDSAASARLINARAESIAEKPAFRVPIRRKRCLIIADSFYEWKHDALHKRPFRVLMNDGGLFAFAGIWDRWEKQGQSIISCAIITTAANNTVKPIHDRMPVILEKDDEAAWLSDASLERVLPLLTPYDARAMKAYEISPLVNSPRNNIPAVIEPVQ